MLDDSWMINLAQVWLVHSNLSKAVRVLDTYWWSEDDINLYSNL